MTVGGGEALGLVWGGGRRWGEMAVHVSLVVRGCGCMRCPQRQREMSDGERYVRDDREIVEHVNAAACVRRL